MKKILLTHSYFLAFDPKQKKLSQPYAPLATLYAAAMLKENGHSVHVYDVMFETAASVISKPLNQVRPDIFIIYDDGFNYLTKMCLTNMREAAFEMIRLAKAQDCLVVISSSDATDQYAKYLDAGADFIIAGEGEITLLELVNELNKTGGNVSSVQGLIFRQERVVRKTVPRQVLKDLDTLPTPAWDLIDLKPYIEHWKASKGYFSMNVATTRGCPFKCNWCAKPIYGNRYNSRSPAHVVKELLLLKQNYQFDHIWFCDDIFGLKPGWVHEFADLVEQHQLDLKFKIQSRADLLVQENYVSSLARAGCTEVWMGAESGSQKILDAMDKGIRISQIEQATALLKEYGIKPCFFIQFGYLGETKEDIALTIKMIRKLAPADIGISVSYPLPGTIFYDKVKHELRSKTNWTDSDELALMFTNTFKPGYYKHLHRYVHKIYRKQQAKEKFQFLMKHPLRTDLVSLKKIVSGIYYTAAAIKDKYILQQLEKA